MRLEKYDPNGLDPRAAMATALRQSAQGATFGFADEAYDRIAALYAKALGVPYDEALKEARNMSKNAMAKDWQEAPVESLAANVIGGIPFALSKPAEALSDWSRSSNRLRALGKGGAVGAGLGATAGAGTAAPDPNKPLSDALMARTGGAGWGAAFGGLLGTTGSALGRFFQPSDNVNFSKVGNASSKVESSKAAKLLAQQLGARPDLKDQLARAEAMNTASQNTGIPLTLAEKIAQSPSDPLLAQQKILGGNPQTAGAMESLYAARSGTANQAGQIENALTKQAQQLAPGVNSYDDAATALIQKSKEAAKGVTKQLTDEASPLYQEAFQANKSMQSPVFNRILETPEGKTALKHAATLMQNQMVRTAVPDAELTAAARDLQSVGKVGKLPKDGVASGLKMQTLDNIKKGFDSAISDALSRSSPGTTSSEAKALMDLRSSLVNEMDRLDVTKTIPAGRDPATNLFTASSEHPEGGAYARARSVYSGQPDLLQMRERIGNVANVDPLQAKQVNSQLFSGTQKNAEMAANALGPDNAKIAAAGRIYDVMDTARGDPTSFAGKIAPDSRTNDMLRTYAGGNQLDDTLNVINQAKIGEKFRYGSPTQPLQEAGNTMQQAASGAMDLATGNKLGFVKKIAGMFGKGEDPQFYQDMMDLMTTDQGMELVRRVAGGQGTAIQKQQSANALMQAIQKPLDVAGTSLKNAATIGFTVPKQQSSVFQENSPQVQGLPPGFQLETQGLPSGFILDRRKP